MSTDTVTRKVPTGTWTVDPVHSSIAFAITHNNVATFRSTSSLMMMVTPRIIIQEEEEAFKEEKAGVAADAPA